MNNILGLLIGFLYVAIILATSGLLKKLGSEVTRKYIHIMLSNWWIIVILFFDNVIWASICPAAFVIINYISYKYNIIKTMEREKNDGLGTVYYAFSLLVMVIFTFQIINQPWIGLCGILVMGYGDGFAAVLGKKIKSKQYKIGQTTKSVAGSLTMFIITFVIIMAIFSLKVVSGAWWKALIVALVATIIEAVSIKGTDNITVPLIVSFSSYLLTLI